ncbi:excalibur calcium-binding domain-containing protein [Alcanivorax sp. S6407]|nr:excalibur calcium-binding domain-containing protein [Alcanivorax sp. S6407]
MEEPVNTYRSDFRCDGRQHCSQMTSRAEAEFFTRNCPNTKMDGDRDGIPCENDSRF